jgi:exodeoxyribonuclease VII large subunit
VADRRAPTPSAAAEIVAPDRLEVAVRIGIAAGTMDSVLRRRIDGAHEATRRAVQRIDRHAPALDRERQRVDDLARRALASVEHRTREATQQVGGCVWRLRALDPFATLERGYAIVQKEQLIVSSIGQATPGDALSVRLRDGSFGAHVDGGTGSVKRRTLKKHVLDAQAPLFTMPEERA